MTDLEKKLSDLIRAVVREELESTSERSRPTEWLSVAEAAKVLSVSTRTIWRRISEGRLPSYRSGGVVRVKRDELLAADGRKTREPPREELSPEELALRDFGPASARR